MTRDLSLDEAIPTPFRPHSMSHVMSSLRTGVLESDLKEEAIIEDPSPEYNRGNDTSDVGIIVTLSFNSVNLVSDIFFPYISDGEYKICWKIQQKSLSLTIKDKTTCPIIRVHFNLQIKDT